MILLKDILYKVTLERVVGSTSIAIHNMEFDSRKVSLNDVFVAIKGSLTDGHEYIKTAANKGALAIICEVLPEDMVNGITYVQVSDTHKAMAIMASNYYGNPSAELKLVGVTGTNGKTTVSSLLHQLIKKAGYVAGLISTVKIVVGDDEYKTSLTTPDSVTINKYLRMMVDAGAVLLYGS